MIKKLWQLICCSIICGNALGREFIDDYAVVIDAGSTGSRCFVFHVQIDLHSHRNISSHPCGKVVPGLSAFSSHPSDVADYFAPLLSIAATRIPAAFHSQTAIHIKATAGMRLLSEVRQSIIWQSLVDGMSRRDEIPFFLTSDHVGTIDGHAEAFFAVLASNYIAGSIDGNLHPVHGRSLLGALDMGGSSTQLIFFNGTDDAQKIHADDFWSHSWLNYGVNRVHERVLDYIQAQHIHDALARSMNELSATSSVSTTNHILAQSNEDMIVDDMLAQDGCNDVIISNPCGFKGHQLVRNNLASNNADGLRNSILFGTGDSDQCIDIIEKVIWPEHSDSDSERRRKGKPIDEIEHPAVRGHHFYAMSVYYYALDCMRHLGPADLDHWPSPSLDEIGAAAATFCSMDWAELEGQAHGPSRHPFTAPDQLHDRCFEVLYIITLLEKGFGFDRHDRSITYALEVGGKEVEWTLGFALAEIDFNPLLLAQAELEYQLQLANSSPLHSMKTIVSAPLEVVGAFLQGVLSSFQLLVSSGQSALLIAAKMLWRVLNSLRPGTSDPSIV
jgi:hypothetical protein